VCAAGLTPAPVRLHAHQPVQVVTAMGAAVGPAAMERAEHSLLLANEQSHLPMTCSPFSRSRVLLDLRTMTRPFYRFLTLVPHDSISYRMVASPLPRTYKSRFTQNVNFRPSGVSCGVSTSSHGAAIARLGRRRGVARFAQVARVRGSTAVKARCATFGWLEGTHWSRVEGLRRANRPAAGPCAAHPESAPGGNRTRGLRLERPLLFDSPKRTVDH
jgi:hypothetical protein